MEVIVITNGDLDHFCTCTDLFCGRCALIMQALKIVAEEEKKETIN